MKLIRMSKVTTTQVKYRVLVKSGNDYFKIGTILIKRLEGDIFYIPSQRQIVCSSRNIVNKIIDKVDWHKSGRVQLKMQDSSYDILEIGMGEKFPPKANVLKRQAIQNIGFQEIVRDTIIDFSKLSKFAEKRDDFDVVLDMGDYKGSIQFVFSIISGRLLVAKWSGKNVPIREVSDEVKDRILSGQKRCLGSESNNADKLLQYTLLKYSGTEELPTGRRVFVTTDSKISRKV